MSVICVDPGGYGLLIAILVLESLALAAIFLHPHYLKWKAKRDAREVSLNGGKRKKKAKKDGKVKKQPPVDVFLPLPLLLSALPRLCGFAAAAS